MGAARWNDAPAHLAQPEGHVLCRDSKIGSLKHLQAPCDAEAVHGCDDRLEHVGELSLGRIFVAQLVSRRQQGDGFLQIHPRRECLVPGPRQDGYPEVGVLVELHEGLVESQEHVTGEGVHRLRPVDGDDGDVIPLLELNRAQSFHGFSSLRSQVISGRSLQPGGISAA